MIKRIFLFATVSFLFLSACKQSDKKNIPISEEVITTYYLFRHAEKNRSDTTLTDPELSQIGNLRAINWAHYFDSIPLNDIYSTNFARTQQTVVPIATAKQLIIQSYEPKSLITNEFLEKTRGHLVLISGHSNTTPRMVNQLIGREQFPDMDDLDNSSLYVVRFKDSIPTVKIRKVFLPRE